MIALAQFLSDEDLIDLKNNKSLLEATQKAAAEELARRETLKTESNDV